MLLAVFCFGVLFFSRGVSSSSVQGQAEIGANAEVIALLTTVAVTLEWDPNTEPDVAGYELGYGTVSGNYTDRISVTSTTVTVAVLTPGTTYFFAVRARNTAGLYSLFSPEVPYTVPASTPTPAPTATATATATATVTPAPTPSPDFSITVNPPSQNAAAGGGFLQFFVDITRVNGFSAPIIISVTGLPDGIASRFNPNPTTGNGANHILFVGFIPSGSYTFTVTGQSFEQPPITRTAQATLVKP